MDKDDKRLLDEMELLAMDTKKEFHYEKLTGKWGWCDRGEDIMDYGFIHDTRLHALRDAVAPHLPPLVD